MNNDRVGARLKNRQGMMDDIKLHPLDTGWDPPFLHVLNQIGDIEYQARRARSELLLTFEFPRGQYLFQ